jgi:transcriptional regulator with XRE-family HTH domain
MKAETEKIRERVLSLIRAEFESDAAFEREMELNEKTVSNWRRGRSTSFMSILPELSEKFGVNVGELLDIPIKDDSSELSEEELELLTLYRKSHVLPKKMRASLKQTIEATVNMYIDAFAEQKKAKRQKK